MTPEFPKRLEIELSANCNLSCSYCPRRHLPPLAGLMDFDLFAKIIAEASAWPETILTLHRRGESLLHPRFVDICQLIKGRFAEVQIATNGTMLDPQKGEAMAQAVDFVSFSIDHPLNFNLTRHPAKYQDVERKILEFLQLNNGRAKTQVSMVRTNTTKAEHVEEFVATWKGRVDRVRVYEEHSTDGNFGSLTNPRPQRLPCAMVNYECLVFFDGKVGRCNHDWAGSPLGDLNHQSVQEVWHSPQYQDLRQQHRSLNIHDQVCSNCDSWYPEEGFQGTGETFHQKD